MIKSLDICSGLAQYCQSLSLTTSSLRFTYETEDFNHLDLIQEIELDPGFPAPPAWSHCIATVRINRWIFYLGFNIQTDQANSLNSKSYNYRIPLSKCQILEFNILPTESHFRYSKYYCQIGALYAIETQMCLVIRSTVVDCFRVWWLVEPFIIISI